MRKLLTIFLLCASIASLAQTRPRANQVRFTPAGTISATDVQAAIEEVASEAGGGGASNWGDLGGTLSDQTDLQAALDAVDPRGVQDFPIPAAAMWPRATDGCAPLANYEMGTSLLNVVGLRFGLTAQEFAQTHFTLPKKWNNGTVTFRIKWKPEASGTGNVRFGVQAVAYGNDDPLTAAFGTEVVVTDGFLATDDYHISSISGSLTIAGTPQDGDLIALQINRDPAHTDDTFSHAAILLEIEIFYTTTAATDE